MSEILKNREVIFEMQQIGALIKVTAMDVASLTEVVIQGPVNAHESILKMNALKKLEYVLRKKQLIE
jgi:hypothetical protein